MEKTTQYRKAVYVSSATGNKTVCTLEVRVTDIDGFFSYELGAWMNEGVVEIDGYTSTSHRNQKHMEEKVHEFEEKVKLQVRDYLDRQVTDTIKPFLETEGYKLYDPQQEFNRSNKERNDRITELMNKQ